MKRSTTDYKQFKLVNDNREKGVSEKHVKELMLAIKGCNMLEYKPIIVNEKFEVMDGQHRLMAAQRLNLPIWYEVKADTNMIEIAKANLNRSWNTRDYLHLYASNGVESYIKLRDFMNRNGLSLPIAVNIACGVSQVNLREFREGKFVFNESKMNANIRMRQESIKIIQSQIGYRSFLGSSKIWKAIGFIVDHPDFDEAKWINNLMVLANRVSMRASTKDYLEMMVKIYNFRNQKRIVFKEEDALE